MRIYAFLIEWGRTSAGCDFGSNYKGKWSGFRDFSVYSLYLWVKKINSFSWLWWGGGTGKHRNTCVFLHFWSDEAGQLNRFRNYHYKTFLMINSFWSSNHGLALIKSSCFRFNIYKNQLYLLSLPEMINRCPAIGYSWIWQIMKITEGDNFTLGLIRWNHLILNSTCIRIDWVGESYHQMFKLYVFCFRSYTNIHERIGFFMFLIFFSYLKHS